MLHDAAISCICYEHIWKVSIFSHPSLQASNHIFLHHKSRVETVSAKINETSGNLIGKQAFCPGKQSQEIPRVSMPPYQFLSKRRFGFHRSTALPPLEQYLPPPAKLPDWECQHESSQGEQHRQLYPWSHQPWRITEHLSSKLTRKHKARVFVGFCSTIMLATSCGTIKITILLKCTKKITSLRVPSNRFKTSERKGIQSMATWARSWRSTGTTKKLVVSFSHTYSPFLYVYKIHTSYFILIPIPIHIPLQIHRVHLHLYLYLKTETHTPIYT